MKLALIILALLLPALAGAQTPVSATTGILFQSSSDHAALNTDGTPVVTNYLIRFIPGISCPAVAPVSVGKPVPDAGAAILVKPWAPLGTLPANCAYTATVAAVGPTGLEGVSAPSLPFWRLVAKVPAAPGQPVLQP